MQSLDMNFSSLNADDLISHSYMLTRRNYEAYLYFRTEYRPSSLGNDFERMVVVKEKKKFNFKKMLSDLKERLEGYDGFLSVSPNTDTYSFIDAEYRVGSSFSKDAFNNYIVPKSEFSSRVKTRRK